MTDDAAPRPAASGERELQGWKEIAAYLGVTVRRAQQWESELQLPVTRLRLERRARVLASTALLDEWRRTRQARTPQFPPNRPLPTPPPPPSPVPAPRRRTIAAWMASAAVCIVAMLAIWALAPSAPVPVRAAINDGGLEAFDAGGRPLWRKTFPEGAAQAPELALYSARTLDVWRSNNVIVDDIDRDGSREVLFRLGVTRPMGEPQGDRVLCFDAKGVERWRFTPGRPITWRDRQFDAAYTVHWMVGPIQVDGRSVVAVGAQNQFFPFQVSMLDAASGRLRGEFWHLGGLATVLAADTDGDGRVEITAAGVNNPGPGAGLPALVRLRLPLPAGGGQPDPFTAAERQPVDYVLFPPVDALNEEELPRMVSWMKCAGGKTLELGVSYGARLPDRGQIYYTLDEHLQALDARPCDLLRNYYRRLADDHRLPCPLGDAEIATWRNVRRFERMPNANDPATRALWRM
jgi:hypothetical protein